MIVASVSKPGSIRELNQDFVLADAEHRLLILADGSGPAGQQAAEETARKIWKRICEIAPVTSGAENEYRLNEAIDLACLPADATTTAISIATAWANRGVLVTIARGHCAAISSAEPGNLIQNNTLAGPVQPGQSWLLCTEGIVSALKSMGTVTSLLTMPESPPDTDTMQARLNDFAAANAAIYDGDDRSAILFSLEASDVTAGQPREIELFEHCNREFSVPVWAPLVAAAGTAISGAYALFKLRKHLPLLMRTLGKK